MKDNSEIAEGGNEITRTEALITTTDMLLSSVHEFVDMSLRVNEQSIEISALLISWHASPTTRRELR